MEKKHTGLGAFLKGGVFLAVCLLIALNAELSIEAAKKSLGICVNVIIPSLFPFAIFATAVVKSGMGEQIGKIFSPVMRPLFKISGCGAIPFILGFLGGYPMGAQLTGELYQQGSLTKNEAERLLAFCNNSGPLFILGTVGIGLFGNRSYGVLLLVCHIAAAVTVGLLLRFFAAKNAKSAPVAKAKRLSPPFGEILAESIKSSALSILLVSSYVILFGVIVALFERYGVIRLFSSLFFGLSDAARTVLAKGFFEITNGCNAAAGASLPIGQALALSSTIISWAGLSVHFQVAGVLGKCRLNKVPYFLGKAASALLAGLYTHLFLRFVPAVSPVFASFGAPMAVPPTVSAWAKLCLALLLFTLLLILFLFLARKVDDMVYNQKHKRP